jgi:ubiquinone/menaquinone biosynthesis C-methylase UbiE
MKKKKKEVEKFFDKYAEVYSSSGYATPDINARTAMSFADDITWHFILKYIPKQKNVKILDAGSGDGFWAQKLIEMGYKNLTLLDISKDLLYIARKRLSNLDIEHNAEYIKSDIVDMRELQSNVFDYVFSQYDAVSYCMKPLEALKELARVSKKNTYVIVSLDTKFRRVSEYIEAGWLKEARILLDSNISNEFGFPQYNFSWEELAQIYEQSGLKVIEVVGAPVFMHQVREEILEKLEQDSKIREGLLEMELEYCTNKSLVNFAGHLQMVGKKE